MQFLLLVVLTVGAEPPGRCSVAPLRQNPDGYFWPLADLRSFVASAELIVRVRSDSASVDPHSRPPFEASTRVHFTVLEVLHGTAPADLWINGRIVDRDDFNPGPVPYRIVRTTGQRGSCFTDEYRQGAEYLLLLRHAPHVIPLIADVAEMRLNPYWAALAPLNEQVRGPADPWVNWVRATLFDPGLGVSQPFLPMDQVHALLRPAPSNVR